MKPSYTRQDIFEINKNYPKLFKLPIKKLNIPSRNNTIVRERTMKKNSPSTQDITPRQEYNNSVIRQNIPNIMKAPNKLKKNSENNYLDDSLSQLSEILTKKNLNFSGLVGKIPGINEGPNFVYDKLISERSSINRAKILSQKIGALKLPLSNISSKEALANSDRDKKFFSDNNIVKIDGNNRYWEKSGVKEENIEVTCWCFGK